MTNPTRAWQVKVELFRALVLSIPTLTLTERNNLLSMVAELAEVEELQEPPR